MKISLKKYVENTKMHTIWSYASMSNELAFLFSHYIHINALPVELFC